MFSASAIQILGPEETGFVRQTAKEVRDKPPPCPRVDTGNCNWRLRSRFLDFSISHFLAVPTYPYWFVPSNAEFASPQKNRILLDALSAYLTNHKALCYRVGSGSDTVRRGRGTPPLIASHRHPTPPLLYSTLSYPILPCPTCLPYPWFAPH